MKEFIIALTICISLLTLGFYFVAKVSADELPKDCTYVAKPSDMIYYSCSPEAKGTVKLMLWICGQSYTIDMKCPK